MPTIPQPIKASEPRVLRDRKQYLWTHVVQVQHEAPEEISDIYIDLLGRVVILQFWDGELLAYLTLRPKEISAFKELL